MILAVLGGKGAPGPSFAYATCGPLSGAGWETGDRGERMIWTRERPQIRMGVLGSLRVGREGVAGESRGEKNLGEDLNDHMPE